MTNNRKRQHFFDLHPLATAVTDMNMNRFFYVNDRFCEMTRHTREEFRRETSTELDLFSKYDRERFITDLNIYGEIKELEVNFKRKDEAVINTLMFARLITNGRQRYVLSIFCDMTEMRRIETRRLQEKNNKAIETLAGGIAHEFNNALAGFTGSIELLEMELSDNEGVNQYTEAMRTSAQRMTEATRQLLAYARGGKYKEKIVSLSKFIETTLPLLNRTINPSIKIATNLSLNTPHVKVDPAQIQMVLSGVLTNASEAIDGKGEITIFTGEKTIDEKFSKINPDIKPGRYAYLAIKDKGRGMDEETKKRIFDPFFTTKFQGRGLGMAAAYGIVKNHDGWIYIDSIPAKGTKVSVFLPAIEAEIKKEIEPTKGSIERRKDNRFNVARGAVVIPEHDHLKQGQIIDISRGGLAFNYNNGKDLTKEFADLAISMVFKTFYLDKIPCKIISHGTTDAVFPQNQEKMKRVSLRFGELTQKQTDQLEYFLQNLTTNPI